MSVTQDYKENNLVTFTFTPDEVTALAGAALAGAVKIGMNSQFALNDGDEVTANRLLDMGDLLLSAHDKLVRK